MQANMLLIHNAMLDNLINMIAFATLSNKYLVLANYKGI